MLASAMGWGPNRRDWICNVSENVVALSGAVTVALAMACVAGQQVTAHADPAGVSEQELMDYVKAHPEDFVGINDRLIASGGDPLQVKVSGRSGTVDAQTAADLKAGQSGQTPGSGIGPQSVPTDAFEVSGYWVPGATNAVFVGQWDFRDDFVNGSDPDDFASVMLELPSCAPIISTTYNSYYYDGERTTDATMYLKDGGLSTKSPITGLKDRASGFKLNVDHGHMTTTVNRALCGPSWTGQLGGQFAYEHNQDGGSAASVSASWAGLSIGYSGTPSTRQQSTQPVYLTVG